MDIKSINKALDMLTDMTDRITAFCAENAGIDPEEAEESLYLVRAFFITEDEYQVCARVYIPEKEINFHAEINIDTIAEESGVSEFNDADMMSYLETEESILLTEAVPVLRDKTARIFRNAPKLADIMIREGFMNEDGDMTDAQIESFRKSVYIDSLSFEADYDGITAQIYLGSSGMTPMMFDMLDDNSVEILGWGGR